MGKRGNSRLLLLLLASLGGCRESDKPPTFAVNDSSGVEIVTSTSPITRGVWLVDAEPVLRIGGPGTELHLVRAGLRLNSGDLLIATATDLRLFDTAGRLITSAGGEGDGPGEFRSISAVLSDSSDLVYVWDRLARRSTYTPTLDFVESRSLNQTALKSVAPYVAVVRPVSQSRLLLSANRMEPREPEVGKVFRAPWLHALVDATGKADTILQHDGGFAEVYLGDRRSTVVYFSPHYSAAVGPRGNAVISDAASFELREYSPAGALVRLIRREAPRRRPTAEDVTEAIAAKRALLSASRPSAEVERMLRALPRPSNYPALSGLTIDRLGYLWVREPVGPRDSSTTWAIFSSDGRWYTQVTARGLLTALDIGSDYIVASTRDELGQEFVQLHALRRDSGPDRPDA